MGNGPHHLNWEARQIYQAMPDTDQWLEARQIAPLCGLRPEKVASEILHHLAHLIERRAPREPTHGKYKYRKKQI